MREHDKRIIILGVSGMLGNAVYRLLSHSEGFEVFGTVRSMGSISVFSDEIKSNIVQGVDIENFDHLLSVLSSCKPDVVINCIGLVKQLAASNNPLDALPINTIFPHRLANICSAIGARLIHMSTDCVFSGKKGCYVESDFPDAYDLYGRSKLIGEVDYPHAITLRTSIIGHELNGSRSLIDWFLSQQGSVSGYKNAIFSGLPTVEIARIIRDFVIPNKELSGVYHVSAEPINKFDLLNLVAEIYGKKIEIREDESISINRSLDSARFRDATGFKPQSWPEMIARMKNFN
ncbi:NAD(P)-dependent oxidoreductase [Chromobacterium sp. Panama]|uniref:dTDP-4-dehydrorhamnose reductase family protein n=1 Tax=Chromobacterium sp. Panama TaxID=2161826 RepID=UPI000D31DE37|nr:SDR family oxidoreductase [Chromobacterium sp. Panama]PTU66615.1 NAD(P)-dependent oxidoreductase [Chromobacterium sp. Panama]